MKKIFFSLLVVFSLVFSGCSNQSVSESGQKVVLPSKYQKDNDNFKQMIIVFNESREISFALSGKKSAQVRQEEEKMISLIKEGILLGNKLSDDYLDFLHLELKFMLEKKLLKSNEMYLEGITKDVVSKQLKSQSLLSEWDAWWVKNRDEIGDKVFE